MELTEPLLHDNKVKLVSTTTWTTVKQIALKNVCFQEQNL